MTTFDKMNQAEIKRCNFNYKVRWQWKHGREEEGIAQGYQVAVFVNIHNRANYLKKCLKSLYESSLDKVILMLIDDNSTEQEAINQIEGFAHPEAQTMKVRVIDKKKIGRQRIFVNTHNLAEWAMEEFGVKVLVILDSDTTVKKDWLGRMIEVYEKYKKDKLTNLPINKPVFSHWVQLLQSCSTENTV